MSFDDQYSSDESIGSDGGGEEVSSLLAPTIAALSSASADESEKIAHLTTLCDALAFTEYEEDLYSLPLDGIIPWLVAGVGESTADIMLLSARVLTYLLDLVPRTAAALVQHGGVEVLCNPLRGIEYLDVAEQCLDALEKLSKREPVACLKEGVVTVVFSFIDFFEVPMQRVALSTVNNVCKEIPEDDLSTVSDAVPILCNLLEHQDRKLVQSAATCLISIVKSFNCSSELLDKLCKDGLVDQCVKMISPDGRMMLNESVYTGMIGLLVRLSTHSLEALRTLYKLNISSLLENILRSCDLSRGTPHSLSTDMSFDQMFVTLRLLNQLIPPFTSDDTEAQLVLSKKNVLINQSEFLHQFAFHTIPALVQAVNSGANTCISFGCVSIVKNYVSFIAPDMLREVAKNLNMPCFLAGLLSRKDHHILLPALNLVEILMTTLPGEFYNSFVKEGVVHAIRALYCSQSEPLEQQPGQCLCYAFDPCLCPSSPESKTCRLQKSTLSTLAQSIMSTFFTESLISKMGFSENLRSLKAICTALDNNVNNSTFNCAKKEEYLLQTLNQILMELKGRESMSTFEFIESGLVRSLAYYLSNGKYFQRSLNSVSELDAYHTVLERIQIFASMSLSGQRWEDFPLTLLVRHLQNALSSLDCFPVVLSSAYKPRSRVTDIPANSSSTHPCLCVNFVKGEGEINLCDYGSVLNIEFSTSYNAIEGFLWPKVSKIPAVQKRGRPNKRQKSSKKPKDLKTGLFDPAESSTSYCNEDDCEQKLVFLFNGKQLDPNITLYQAILQEKINVDSDTVIGAAFWNEIYTVTYRRVKEKHPCSSLISVDNSDGLSWQKLSFFSCALLGELPCKVEKSNSAYDILFLLKILQGLNQFSFHLSSYERRNAFSEGRINKVDDLKVIETSLPQNEFISSKLTDKLEQQMHDPLAISTGTMPLWCSQLVVACPFLFSFEARWKYFCLNAFGSFRYQTKNSEKNSINTIYDRRTLSAEMPRKRFKVFRKNILGSAAKMMSWYARKKKLLEIEFIGEVGTGLGPTLEFYTLVSQELQKVGMFMWRGDQESCSKSSKVISDSKFVSAPCGLFPRPWSGVEDSSNGIKYSKALKNFFLLGQLIARAIQDGRILDLQFSRAFYKLILDLDLDIYDILSFDPELGRTLTEFQALVSRKRCLENESRRHAKNTYDIYFQDTSIEDLCLDFSLPGYPDYVLASNSNSNMVNQSNLEEYVSMVVDATIRSGISRQLDSFKSGFDQVFPIKTLQIFSAEELERMICGEQDSWNINQLQDHINFDHGYTSSSPTVKKFLEIVQEFDCQQRRAFVLFMTGAPRLPPGGLASLTPKLTIVRKHCSNDTDKELPSVMTCANYLKLPPYSSKEIMREKLLFAIMEGQGSFHLS